MIDIVKVMWFKRLMSILVLILVFFLGLGFGQMGKSSQTENKPTKNTTQKASIEKELTQKQVKEFLVAYYTKKDLEENRNRYKDYMTEGLYNATVSEENKAQNQAYKGYVVNYEFQDAQIYIDKINHRVITKITYTNDLLKKKDSNEGAQVGVTNHTTLQLDYTKVNGKYLVNHMSTLLITDSSNPSATKDAYGAIAPSESTNE
ncbi:TPA: hypothetical protein ACGQHX_000120 [Streptococcus agalactiae]|uniref:hypothetical protein n=1 Tax=Streptococcus anginosus TaxID=1328 RepID=UPI0021F8D9F0|nr:hypothetical protein [Streptococcus anginosus]HEO5192949.1 hypothetical protein [Streptococcus agalactiae]HEP2692360.1 hypothetical protein [Streptococcus pyogenes]MBS6901952.1 hypothetical protein [Streptococcus anginosus]MCW1084009.1 hypothetical protein [Streptococcus anginosus]MED5849989.1 hypothetical protein [Streptococcus anginosus]